MKYTAMFYAMAVYMWHRTFKFTAMVTTLANNGEILCQKAGN